jgi:hypothetical protein
MVTIPIVSQMRYTPLMTACLVILPCMEPTPKAELRSGLPGPDMNADRSNAVYVHS